MLHLPCDSSSTLMNVWLPMMFQLYMMLHIPYMSFGLPPYNTFSKHNLHHPQYVVACDNSRHDMTWHYWHGLLDDMEMSSHSWCSMLCVCLRGFFYPLSYDLILRSLQWSQVLSCGHKLVPLFFLLVDQLVYPTTKRSCSMFPFFIMFAWHDKVPSFSIHSWWDDISATKTRILR